MMAPKKPTKPMIPPKGTKKSKTKGACRALALAGVFAMANGCAGVQEHLDDAHTALAELNGELNEIEAAANRLCPPPVAETQACKALLASWVATQEGYESAVVGVQAGQSITGALSAAWEAAKDAGNAIAKLLGFKAVAGAPVAQPLKVVEPQSRIDLEPNPYLKTAFAKLPVDREVF